MPVRPVAIILADFTVENQFRLEATVARIAAATRATCQSIADRAKLVKY
jgi:hypothetical protein